MAATGASVFPGVAGRAPMWTLGSEMTKLIRGAKGVFPS